MKHYEGQQQVDPGLYLDTREWSLHPHRENGPLPGDPTRDYMRIPAVAMLVVGPLLGLAFAIFLPFVGFVMLGRLLVQVAARLATDLGRSSARALRPAWQPAMAFLSRRRRSGEKAEHEDDWSREAERKLDEEEDAEND